MSTVGIQVITEESEKVVTENVVSEMHSKIMTEALYALPKENIEASLLTKENSSADSGILMSKSSSDVSDFANKKDEENASSIQKPVEEHLSTNHSATEIEDQQSEKQNNLSLDSKCSQESKASSNSSKSSCKSSSTLKSSQNFCNNDEDSRSSISSSTSTIKEDQQSEKQNNLSLDSKCSQESKASSYSSKSSCKSNSTLKSSQSFCNNDEDSRSSISSSTSTIKASKQKDNKSDDENNSRSSFSSVSQSTSPKKQSDAESTFKRSQSISTNLTDDEDSQSTITSSHSQSTTKNSQSVGNRSDDESTFKRSQNANTNLTGDDNSHLNNESNVENNSRSIKKSTPEKQNENKKPKKYLAIVDSDSEDDMVVPHKINNKEKDTDSDSSISQSVQSSKPKLNKKKSKVKNKMQFIDSDSDEESEKHKENKSGEDNGSDRENKDFRPPHKSNKISNVVDSDSESSSDNGSQKEGKISSGEEDNTGDAKDKKKKPKKKRTGSARASKDIAMQQIHSETQRLIRESHLSLPYHRPKQRTLEEFLNRKKMASSIPKNLTCAEKVKMFPEFISKVVEEKEKEAELFYKSSDSEEDEKEEPMEVDQTDTENKNLNENENKTEAINIADTQKLSQDHIQEIHNKREVLQRRSADFGVPRKLFMEDANDMEETDNVDTSKGYLDEDENSDPNIATLKKKNREVKTGLRESSVPRKLFGDGIEEMEVDMDIDTNENDKSISKEQIGDSKKPSENSEKVTESSENKTVLDDGTEEIVLKLSESDFDISDDKKTMDLNKSNDVIGQNKDQESIMISETPIISNKDLIKTSIVSDEPKLIENSDESKIIENSEESDPILKLAKESREENEIIDHNVLREDFGRLPELDEPIEKPSLKKQILANILKTKPIIKASPGSVIDFTSSEKIKEGVSKLQERFVRHAAVRRPRADMVSEIKVIRTEGVGDDIKVIEEIIPFKKDIIEDDPRKECKPGEKLKILREDLKRKIAIVRDEEWRQKEENENEDEEIETTKDKGDDFYKDLPDEEELLDDEESAESEPEEDDMPIVESRRKTCDFGDEEAEESDNDDDEDIEAVENDNDEDEKEEEDEEEEEGEEEDENTEIEQEEEEKETYKPKILKRIRRPVDEEEESSQSNDTNFPLQVSKGSASDPDDIPPFQPRDRCYSDSRSQACKTPLLKPANILSMISPVAQLTALNTSLDSAKKSASKTTTFNFGNFNSNSAENSPFAENRSQSNCNMEKMNSLQKKLFDDAPESVHDSEILEVCSGRFTETQSSQPANINTQSNVTDSQIINICSGAFATQVGVAKNSVTDTQFRDICSGAFGTQVDEANKVESENFKHPSNTQSGVTDSQIRDICSGNFITQTGKPKKHEPISPNLPINDETSQDITLTLDDDEDSKSSPAKMSSTTNRSADSMFSSDSKSPDQSLAITTTTNTTTNTTTTTTTSKTNTAPQKNPMDAWLQKASKPTIIPNQPKKNEVSETQLMDLCSGPFVSQSQNIKESRKDELPHIQNETSQDFRLTLDDESNSPAKKSPQKQKTKKPETSLNQESAKEEPKSAKSNLRIAFSSDEDEDGKEKSARPKKKVLKKKKVQRLNLSDDEDDNPKEFSDEEESEVEEEEDEELFVDYDSEENEVSVSKKDIKKVAANYLENEAELSESDWDSADEDEHDLDKLEYEEADAEDIDENKMKDQLDKIHMKQLMDEDQRDVRMLQELLFDDGDLHSEGAGRERKFKWKNIDDMGDDELKPRTEDDGDAIDEEVDTTVELQMRKIRYEQQKFLEEKEKTIQTEIDHDFGDGKFIKGLKVVSVRSTSKTSVNEQKIVKSNSLGIKSITVTNNLTAKKTFMSSKSLSFGNMKGSFLARGDETLVRIAQNLPQTSKGSMKGGRKGKFVFAHLSPSVSKEPQVDSEQENDNTPAKEKNQRKRKMFSSQSSQTPRTMKKAKVEDRAPGKKLF